MAIFVFFAWMIEAGEYLGWIETEAQDPASKAYRLAHQGLALIKDELIGTPIEVLGQHRIRKRPASGETIVIESSPAGMVTRSMGEEQPAQELIDLGPGGGVSFRPYRGAALEIKIRACTDDGGVYDVNLILPPTSRPLGGKAGA